MRNIHYPWYRVRREMTQHAAGRKNAGVRLEGGGAPLGPQWGCQGLLPGDAHRTALVEDSFAHLSERTLANHFEQLDRTSCNFPWKLQGVRNGKHATLHNIRRMSAAAMEEDWSGRREKASPLPSASQRPARLTA